MTHFNITEHYSRVRLLNKKINPNSAPSNIIMPDADTRLLRAKLIIEEALETVHALGVQIWTGTPENSRFDDNVEMGNLVFRCTHEPDMVEIVDGCADISVVTIGTLVACGVPDRELLKIVDENNLAKFGPGGYKREDGKWIKPPNHQPPDIKGFLKRNGWDA